MIMAALFAETGFELRVTDTKNSMVRNFNLIFMKIGTLAYLLQQAQLQTILKFEQIELTNFYNGINFNGDIHG